MAGIYVHIPFCKKACNYCNFHFSISKNHRQIIESILMEIEMNQKKISKKIISTIYIGGGTPSIIDEKFINQILKSIMSKYIITSDCEITIEANPDDINEKKLKSWKKSGINRISLGVQSFNDLILKKLNRSHNSTVAIRAIEKIQNQFTNYSIDLMFGTPNSNYSTVLNDLKKIKEIFPPHISIYNMTVEENTVMEKQLKKEKISLPNDNIIMSHFDQIHTFMKEIGYQNYEISSYCQEGFKSKHNSNYWMDKSYIGFGPGAHSYDKKFRYWNISDNDMYINKIKNSEKVFLKERLSTKNKINEYIMTRIRTSTGINLEELKNKFEINLYEKKNIEIDTMVKNMLLKKSNKKIKLTNEGKKIVDHITTKIMI